MTMELLKQGIVELASTLVSGKFLMPVGRNFERIPRHKHGTRLLFAVEAQQNIGKAKDGTGRLVGRA